MSRSIYDYDSAEIVDMDEKEWERITSSYVDAGEFFRDDYSEYFSCIYWSDDEDCMYKFIYRAPEESRPIDIDDERYEVLVKAIQYTNPVC